MDENPLICQPDVIGIAFVVQEERKEAKLLFKYPQHGYDHDNRASTSTAVTEMHYRNVKGGKLKGDKIAETTATTSIRHQGGEGGGGNQNKTTSNIFFRLNASIFAKLFRTKNALCDQPVSLNIEGTIFCCRTVCILSEEKGPSEDPKMKLLFSIIVAVKPIYHENSINPTRTILSSSVSNDLMGGTRRRRSCSSTSMIRHDDDKRNNKNEKQAISDDNSTKQQQQEQQRRHSKNNYTYLYHSVNEHTSLHFEAVRRVHVSISRLCKVLEREEKRCLYVTRQTAHLVNVGGGFEQTKSSSNSVEQGGGGKNSNEGDGANNGGKNKGSGTRSSSIDISDNPVVSAIGIYSTQPAKQSTNEQHITEEEVQQKRLDLMLAAPPPPAHKYTSGNNMSNDAGTDQGHDESSAQLRYKRNCIPRECIPIQGNLAVELAQTYHALSRNILDIRPSADALLSGRDGIVYINMYIAVKIEAAEDLKTNNIPSFVRSSPVPYLRKYHTLLFYPIPAADLLRHKKVNFPKMNADGHILRNIEKLLHVAHDPFKRFDAMAKEMALPLSMVIDAAVLLLEAGACIAIPAMNDTSKFGCSSNSVSMVASQKLDFAQRFGSIPIFMVLSVVTNPVNSVNKAPMVLSGVTTPFNSVNKTSNPRKMTKNERDAKHTISIKEILDFSKSATRALRSNEGTSHDNVQMEILDNVPTAIRIITKQILDMIKTMMIPVGFAHIIAQVGKEAGFETRFVQEAFKTMIKWLRARSIIVEEKEFLVSTTELNGTEGEGSRSHVDDSFKGYGEFLNIILKDTCNGNVSTLALHWKYNRSIQYIEAFRDWGVKNNRIKSVRRISSAKDDWGAP